jgi:hypothetical protein
VAFDAHKNFVLTTVATAPSPATSGTSLVVSTGHGADFPTPPFNAVVWPNSGLPSSSNAEIVRVTGISTDTLTIARSQESSSARTIVVGDQIALTITAKYLSDLENGVAPSYTSLVDGATITWTMDSTKTVQNATVTLGGARTLALSGLIGGMTGVLIVKQDSGGGKTLALPVGSKVINTGGGVINLSTGANAIDIISFIYDGTDLYWAFGMSFT